MKKISLAAILFLTSAMAFGQGACYPGQILLDTGRPANGATVRVCTAGSTGTPCTPLASLFTDPTDSVGASNPLTTDARGNFKICAAAGANYDLQYSGSGLTTLTITNVPLPPTAPITAASVTSASANPANVGTIKLATGDCLDWRNNANSGNIQLCKTAADALDLTAFSSVLAPNVVVNPSSLGTGAALTVGGTSSTTGGISVFIGAFGSQNERLSVVPADGASAATRVGSLSVRASAAGFLTGTENASISGAGAIAGASIALGGGTALTTTNRTGTGNLVLATSPSITTPTISDPTITGNAAVKRIKATQGTALVIGDVGTLTGWGTTATVAAVTGTDAAGSITITSNGTGQTINPTFVLTFHDGTWTNSPLVVASRTDVSGPAANWQITSTTATAVTFQFNNGTPSAGANYSLNFIAVGR
jgi:hypothetical protein